MDTNTLNKLNLYYQEHSWTLGFIGVLVAAVIDVFLCNCGGFAGVRASILQNIFRFSKAASVYEYSSYLDFLTI